MVPLPQTSTFSLQAIQSATLHKASTFPSPSYSESTSSKPSSPHSEDNANDSDDKSTLLTSPTTAAMTAALSNKSALEALELESQHDNEALSSLDRNTLLLSSSSRLCNNSPKIKTRSLPNSPNLLFIPRPTQSSKNNVSNSTVSPSSSSSRASSEVQFKLPSPPPPSSRSLPSSPNLTASNAPTVRRGSFNIFDSKERLEKQGIGGNSRHRNTSTDSDQVRETLDTSDSFSLSGDDFSLDEHTNKADGVRTKRRKSSSFPAALVPPPLTHSMVGYTESSGSSLSEYEAANGTSTREATPPQPPMHSSIGTSLSSSAPEPIRTSTATATAAATANATATANPRRKIVSFHTVNIRTYEQTMSDNPSVSCGPPIGLTWNYSILHPVALDSFEQDRMLDRRCINMFAKKGRIPPQVRLETCMEGGYQVSDIERAVMEIRRIQERMMHDMYNLNGGNDSPLAVAVGEKWKSVKESVNVKATGVTHKIAKMWRAKTSTQRSIRAAATIAGMSEKDESVRGGFKKNGKRGDKSDIVDEGFVHPAYVGGLVYYHSDGRVVKSALKKGVAVAVADQGVQQVVEEEEEQATDHDLEAELDDEIEAAAALKAPQPREEASAGTETGTPPTATDALKASSGNGNVGGSLSPSPASTPSPPIVLSLNSSPSPIPKSRLSDRRTSVQPDPNDDVLIQIVENERISRESEIESKRVNGAIKKKQKKKGACAIM